ncbi:DUF3267 domain-containing protein [Natronococcus occultus]|uniref:Zincin peptidase n=1 Tax=Natronococcus occultus SP4 TaxID=694430 RepID=L0JX03_9EURY|nr:DUF3267 domain-containing protein [Natronococcus occultus]AGB36815.1 Protein of unknown function (DUF3267) [Natronococcus occultus SP4]
MAAATSEGVTPDEDAVEEPIETVRLTRSVAAGLVLVSVVGFFASVYAFGAVLAASYGTSLEPIVLSADALSSGRLLLGAVGLGLLSVVAHELLHGLFMARYGDAPSYGVGVSLIFPYAYARGDASYGRNQLLAVLLAPLAIGTAGGIVAMAIFPSPVWIVPLAVNAAGSVGDLWMALALWRHPADVRIGEHPRPNARGFGIYAPDSESDPNDTVENRRRPLADFLSRTLAGTAVVAVALAALLSGLVFRSLAVGTGTVVVDVGPWTLLRHELHTGVVVLEIGAGPLTVLAVGGGLVWALVGTVWDVLGKP